MAFEKMLMNGGYHPDSDEEEDSESESANQQSNGDGKQIIFNILKLADIAGGFILYMPFCPRQRFSKIINKAFTQKDFGTLQAFESVCLTLL